MARKKRQDAAKEKAAKQKKIAIGGSVLLVALLAYQVPKTMKMLHGGPQHGPAASATTSSPTTPGTTTAVVTPADPNSLAAPSLAGSGEVTTTTTSSSSSGLVSAVPVTADPGQLETFQRFASKDPFAVQASPSGSTPAPKSKPSGAAPSAPKPSAPSTTTPAPTPSQPSAPAPTSAVISLNGQLQSVTVAGAFPTSGAIFDRLGSIFKLVSLTATTAKVAIVGGSYADGASAIPLHVGVPLTLQNTADGAKYTLILEPQGASVQATPGGAGSTTTTPTTTTPTSTTPANVVPSSSGAVG